MTTRAEHDGTGRDLRLLFIQWPVPMASFLRASVSLSVQQKSESMQSLAMQRALDNIVCAWHLGPDFVDTLTTAGELRTLGFQAWWEGKVNPSLLPRQP